MPTLRNKTHNDQISQTENGQTFLHSATGRGTVQRQPTSNPRFPSQPVLPALHLHTCGYSSPYLPTHLSCWQRSVVISWAWGVNTVGVFCSWEDQLRRGLNRQTLEVGRHSGVLGTVRAGLWRLQVGIPLRPCEQLAPWSRVWPHAKPVRGPLQTPIV